MTKHLTLNERLDSLTGRDELEISDYFGHDVWDTYDVIVDEDVPVTPKKISSRLGRMLVFAQKLHDGLPPKLAFDNVLDMTATEVNEFLSLDDEEPAEQVDGKPAEPTDAGKDAPAAD